MENVVKDWIKRPELQEIVADWAYLTYQEDKDPVKYRGLLNLMEEYQQWFEENGYRQTHRGLEICQGEYRFILATFGGRPLYLEVEEPHVTYRVNVYFDQEEYTVDVMEKATISVTEKLRNLLTSSGKTYIIERN